MKLDCKYNCFNQTKKWIRENQTDRIKRNIGAIQSQKYDTSKYKRKADGTIKPTKVVEHNLPTGKQNPYDVIDVITKTGNTNRTFYNKNGDRGMRIDSTDHGFYKSHKMGAHKHIIQYDKNGNMKMKERY